MPRPYEYSKAGVRARYDAAEELAKPFSNVEGVAVILGVHPRTVREAVADGTLAAIRLGGTCRIPTEQLREWAGLTPASTKIGREVVAA